MTAFNTPCVMLKWEPINIALLTSIVIKTYNVYIAMRTSDNEAIQVVTIFATFDAGRKGSILELLFYSL